jgi:hypothetical protein
MALIGNGSYLTKNVGRLMAGGTAAADAGSKSRSNFQKNGAFFNFSFQDKSSSSLPTVGFPDNLCGKGWHMPINFTSYTKAASGSITLTVDSSGLARLLVSAVGSSDITINGDGSMAALIFATGEGTITISSSGEPLAFGFISGNSDISVSMDSESSIVGIGKMGGTTDYVTTLTSKEIAAEVWSSNAAEYNESGTMGNKVNAAGTAGDPWTADMDMYETAGTMGHWIKKLLSVSKFIGLK